MMMIKMMMKLICDWADENNSDGDGDNYNDSDDVVVVDVRSQISMLNRV